MLIHRRTSAAAVEFDCYFALSTSNRSMRDVFRATPQKRSEPSSSEGGYLSRERAPKKRSTKDLREAIDRDTMLKRELIGAFHASEQVLPYYYKLMIWGKDANKQDPTETLKVWLKSEYGAHLPHNTIQLDFNGDAWDLESFFYGLKEEERPPFHEKADEIMKKIQELCGRVMLKDAASKDGLPIRVYKWVRAKMDDRPLKLWDDAASYYHRFGFTKMHTDGNTENIREKINDIWNKWWEDLSVDMKNKFWEYVNTTSIDPPPARIHVSSLNLGEE